MSLKNYLLSIKDTGARHRCWMCSGTGQTGPKSARKDCTNPFCLKTFEDELNAEPSSEEETVAIA